MLYDTWLGTPNVEGFKVGGNPWKSQLHGYDVARNYTQFVDAEGGIHEWRYDYNNRVYETWYASHSDPLHILHKVNNVTFTPGGLVDVTTLRDALGNAIAETTMTYDGLGRKARQQTVQLSTSTVVADLEWGYNELDLVTSIQFHHLGKTAVLGYNERRELTSEILTGNGAAVNPPPYTNQIGGPATGNESAPSNESGPQVVLRWASYLFDPAGNRTSQTIDGVTTTFTHNAASQLKEETVSGQTVYHHYDEWGNEKGRGPTPLPDDATESYEYNYLNLMSTYTNSTTGANWQYDFWPTGERYAKTNLTSHLMEIYVPRAGDVATEYDKPDGGAITYKNTYVQGIGIDQKQTRISSSLERRHYIGDQVGTVDVTLTDAGAVAESGLKDAWGVQLAGGTPSERYGFAQREHDAESGLVHMRARMYDPKLGRFTQVDPIRRNRARKHYVYARNNPLSYVDPMGLEEGHHIVPKSIWEESEIDEAIKAFFNKSTILGKGHNNTLHPAYTKAVEEFIMGKMGGKDIGEAMKRIKNVGEAEKLLKELKQFEPVKVFLEGVEHAFAKTAKAGAKTTEKKLQEMYGEALEEYLVKAVRQKRVGALALVELSSDKLAARLTKTGILRRAAARLGGKAVGLGIGAAVTLILSSEQLAEAESIEDMALILSGEKDMEILVETGMEEIVKPAMEAIQKPVLKVVRDLDDRYSRENLENWGERYRSKVEEP